MSTTTTPLRATPVPLIEGRSSYGEANNVEDDEYTTSFWEIKYIPRNDVEIISICETWWENNMPTLTHALNRAVEIVDSGIAQKDSIIIVSYVKMADYRWGKERSRIEYARMRTYC